jgi:NO-binding membrane sensor protein with MHYT domain
MLTAHNFSYGIVTPLLGYLMSCLGAFLGLRSTARARAATGREKLRWLLLGALSIGATGIWVMHFIAMLGYTVPGQVIHYNVPITILSMLIAVVVVGAGLLVVGFGKPGWRTLIAAGLFTGVGVAAMHYTGMFAVRLNGKMTFDPGLFALSIVIAIVAATAALWAGLNLSGLPATIGASLIMGVAVSGMHYTGMAALHMWPESAPGAGMNMAGGGATAETFLLPLLVGISLVSFVMTATLALSPSEDEMREDAELLQRLGDAHAASQPIVPARPAVPQSWPAQVISQDSRPARHASKSDRWS